MRSAAAETHSSMEGSPATRLPEADSLPDGFVESSAADQVAPPSPAPEAVDPSQTALDTDRPAVSVPDGGDTLGAPSLPVPASGEALDASTAASASADVLESLALTAATEPDHALGQHRPAGDSQGDPSIPLSRSFF